MAYRWLGHKAKIGDLVWYRHQHGSRRYMHSGIVIDRVRQGNGSKAFVRCLNAEHPNEGCRGQVHEFEFAVGGED